MINYTAEPYERNEMKPIPDGIYKTEIIDVKYQNDESLGKESINIQYLIIEDPNFGGRFLYQTIFLKYPNPQDGSPNIVLKIAKNKLNGVLEMCKMSSLRHVSDLIGRKLKIKIKTKPDKKDPNRMRTEIVDYFDYLYIEGSHNNKKQREQTINHGTTNVAACAAAGFDIPF